MKIAQNEQNSAGFIRDSDDPFRVAPNSYITIGFPPFPKNAEFTSPDSGNTKGFLSFRGPCRGKDTGMASFPQRLYGFLNAILLLRKTTFS